MIKNKRIKKNWSEEDVKILIWLISKYADINHYQDVERDFVTYFFIFLDQRGLGIYFNLDSWSNTRILHVQMAKPEKSQLSHKQLERIIINFVGKYCSITI